VRHGPHPLTSPLLHSAGFRHAFFTSEGGVSTGPYASLNFSYSVGDNPDYVAQNFERAAAWLNLEPVDLLFAQQVHGTLALVLASDTAADTVRAQQADAIIASCGAQASCVRTADCVPVLVADCETGRVAAIHAGWRGVANQIVSKTLSQMFQLGSKPESLIAAIGPHIRVSAFEVSEEVAQLINAATEGFDVVMRRPGERPHVSLADSLTEQLRRMGVASERVDDVGGCTFAEPTRFFSYRRSGPASGRHLHAIVARDP